jgi:DNA polymerase (family 10)
MKPELTNYSVADVLERHGRLLEIAGESPFRTRAYSRAAEAIRELEAPLATFAEAGTLREIPGVGPGIATAIQQLLASGSFDDHTALVQRYPESLVELIAVPGIGNKTALKLFTTLGVSSLEGLEEALASNSIATNRGLGARIDATAREGLAALRRRSGRTLLGAALPISSTFMSLFQRSRLSDKISLAGAARRWDVTVGDLDFVIASEDFAATSAAIADLSVVGTSAELPGATLRVTLDGGLQADIFLTSPESWGTALVRATGSAKHLERLGVLPNNASTEEEVYAAKGMPWIPPELREGDLEFARWEEIPDLDKIEEIRGELHTHTTWSDGVASIVDMARAAAERGYDFLGITDHSHGLGVAGGLDVARLAAQRKELTALDGSSSVRLFAGAEVEVHRDGALDFNDRTLNRLDVVVASLHTGLRQPRQQLTERLVHVLENRNVDIIAHPSGRLIERREGGDFDWDRVFDVAAKTGTALEINASPSRLDLDPHLALRAKEAGCLITINCDAHRPDGFADMRYGVAMARRAWLKHENILNCRSSDGVRDWLAARG